MYKSYKMVTLMVNTKGGESETVEHFYKEVDGQLVPMNEAEATFKFLKNFTTVGGNDAVQSIRAFLIDPNGNIVKIEEVKKETVEA